ncbi:MAG: hypothetical protein ACJAXW_002814 [Candidatus Azotimanducaceae bacterium]|jgi:hypothetical protein
MIEFRDEARADLQPIRELTELAFRAKPYAGGPTACARCLGDVYRGHRRVS